MREDTEEIIDVGYWDVNTNKIYKGFFNTHKQLPEPNSQNINHRYTVSKSGIYMGISYIVGENITSDGASLVKSEPKPR